MPEPRARGQRLDPDAEQDQFGEFVPPVGVGVAEETGGEEERGRYLRGLEARQGELEVVDIAIVERKGYGVGGQAALSPLLHEVVDGQRPAPAPEHRQLVGEVPR